MTQRKYDPEDFQSEIEDLNTVVADYKQKLAAGEIKPRKKPVKPLPGWPPISEPEKGFLEGLSELDVRAYARARIEAWLGQVKRHLAKHAGLIRGGRVTPEKIVREAQVEYQRCTGIKLDEELVLEALAGIWPEQRLRRVKQAPKANPKGRARRRLPWRETGPYTLRKAGSVAPSQ